MTTELAKLTLQQLRERCKDSELETSGTKADLLARLEALESTAAGAAEESKVRTAKTPVSDIELQLATIRAETERIRAEGETKRLEMELAIQRERLQGENQILQLHATRRTREYCERSTDSRHQEHQGPPAKRGEGRY